MPSLDYLGEVGPRLNVVLARDARAARINLELPVRVVLSTDLSSLDYRGWTFSPALAYRNDDFLGTHGQFKLAAGPQFATMELMSYFYQVAPRYVAPGRPAYTAKAGYLGSRAEVSYKLPVNDRLSFLSQVAGSYYEGAANQASPLFKRKTNFSVALGFTFSLYHTDATGVGEAE